MTTDEGLIEKARLAASTTEDHWRLLIQLAEALKAHISNEETQAGLHPDTVELVRRFSHALAAKLKLAQDKYGYTNKWMEDNWMAVCRAKLREHVEKGDPLDVAAYCAFLWFHGESTNPPALGYHRIDA